MGEIIQAGGAIGFLRGKFQNRPDTQGFRIIKGQLQPYLLSRVNIQGAQSQLPLRGSGRSLMLDQTFLPLLSFIREKKIHLNNSR